MRNYPKQCVHCPAKKSCRFKYHMKPTLCSIRAGYYCSNCSDYYCDRHSGGRLRRRTENIEAIRYDTQLHCKVCGVPLMHKLTLKGKEFIKKITSGQMDDNTTIGELDNGLPIKVMCVKHIYKRIWLI